MQLDRNINLYLAALMMEMLVQAGEVLVVPEGTQIMMMTREAFENLLLSEADPNFNNYRVISS